VLKKDGALILAAPFSFRLHEEPHDYFRYSPHGLRKLCAEVGLDIDHIEQVGSLWTLVGHKLNSYLALHVARIGGAAQELGKLGHEAPGQPRARLWTLPLVGPTILAISAVARIMDRLFFERQESARLRCRRETRLETVSRFARVVVKHQYCFVGVVIQVLSNQLELRENAVLYGDDVAAGVIGLKYIQ
jgi:hypothetical protein